MDEPRRTATFTRTLLCARRPTPLVLYTTNMISLRALLGDTPPVDAHSKRLHEEPARKDPVKKPHKVNPKVELLTPSWPPCGCVGDPQTIGMLWGHFMGSLTHFFL